MFRKYKYLFYLNTKLFRKKFGFLMETVNVNINIFALQKQN